MNHQTTVQSFDTTDHTELQRELVFSAIRRLTFPNDREIAMHTCIDRSTVCWRRDELLRAGRIVLAGTKKCPYTGIKTKCYAVA